MIHPAPLAEIAGKAFGLHPEPLPVIAFQPRLRVDLPRESLRVLPATLIDIPCPPTLSLAIRRSPPQIPSPT